LTLSKLFDGLSRFGREIHLNSNATTPQK